MDKGTPDYCYGVPKSSTADAKTNQNVKKCGRTTKQTEGFVYATAFDVEVCYSADCTKSAVFVDQIAVFGLDGGFISTFLLPGDSGSLLVSSGKNPLGLLFAGGTVNVNGDFGIANPIGPVLDAFGVSIDGGKGGKPK